MEVVVRLMVAEVVAGKRGRSCIIGSSSSMNMEATFAARTCHYSKCWDINAGKCGLAVLVVVGVRRYWHRFIPNCPCLNPKSMQNNSPLKRVLGYYFAYFLGFRSCPSSP